MKLDLTTYNDINHWLKRKHDQYDYIMRYDAKYLTTGRGRWLEVMQSALERYHFILKRIVDIQEENLNQKS